MDVVNETLAHPERLYRPLSNEEFEEMDLKERRIGDIGKKARIEHHFERLMMKYIVSHLPTPKNLERREVAGRFGRKADQKLVAVRQDLLTSPATTSAKEEAVYLKEVEARHGLPQNTLEQSAKNISRSSSPKELTRRLEEFKGDLEIERGRAMEEAKNFLKTERMELNDKLTGGLSSAGLEKRYYDILDSLNSFPQDSQLAIITFDIDSFKRLNDTYGHNDGDRALKAVVEKLRGVLRRTEDAIGRRGGDEFVVMGIVGPNDSATLSEKIEGAIAEITLVPEEKSEGPASDLGPIKISVTGGISLASKQELEARRTNGINYEKLLARADEIAMQGKVAEKGRIYTSGQINLDQFNNLGQVRDWARKLITRENDRKTGALEAELAKLEKAEEAGELTEEETMFKGYLLEQIRATISSTEAQIDAKIWELARRYKLDIRNKESRQL